MTKGQQELVAFNRGLISRLALARTDLKRTALSASIFKNWMPRNLGSMMLRPGTGYLTPTRDNLVSKSLPFVFSTFDTAQVEITNLAMRVLVNGQPVTRPTVTAAVTNGNFTTDLTGWSDDDESTAVSSWATGSYMSLVGTGPAAARRRQQVTVNEPGVQHALDIVITRGPVTLRIGSAAGLDDYFSQTALSPGNHSLAFTPPGSSFWIELGNTTLNAALVKSCNVAPAGPMVVPAPWPESALSMLRCDQSGDVIFVACNGYQQQRIERRSTNSWSVVKYQTADGPYRPENLTLTTLAASTTTGNGTLTASKGMFKTGHVGAIFRLTSVGQRVTRQFTGANQNGNNIRITGVGENRRFTVSITGTFVATITLQRSVADPGDWVDVSNYTTATSTTVLDGLDNQVVYYRLVVKAGNYTSGTADTVLSYTGGTTDGVVRITAFTSETVVDMEVLTELGSTAATTIWAEGAWSDYRGWPSAVALHDGRLFWPGKDKFRGSVTDAFDTFDPNYEGDAGPIDRSIGSGPVDVISWAISLQRLIAGTDGSVVQVKSSSFDEPLTPTNFTPKTSATQGSSRVGSVKIDDRAIFVQRGGYRVFQVEQQQSLDYSIGDLTQLVPEIGRPGIVAIAVQRQPDTRIHCVRSDGTVAIMVFDPTENVNCWLEYETDGAVEDVLVLPGGDNAEDVVRYTVRREIDGNTMRFHEQWATEQQARGAIDSRIADCHGIYDGVATTTIAAAHLEGKTVVVWADGKDVGTKTVTGGNFTLDAPASYVVYGLGYTAPYQSTRLATVMEQGWSSIGARKRVNSLALLLADTHAQGIKFGQDFDHMDDMPMIEDDELVDPDKIWSEYEKDPVSVNGEWTVNARLCLLAAAPRPVTVLGVALGEESHGSG